MKNPILFIILLIAINMNFSYGSDPEIEPRSQRIKFVNHIHATMHFVQGEVISGINIF